MQFLLSLQRSGVKFCAVCGKIIRQQKEKPLKFFEYHIEFIQVSHVCFQLYVSQKKTFSCKGIVIPFLIILMLVIRSNIFPQIRKHDVYMLQHVKVCCVEHLQTETFQILVPLCVVVSLPVVRASVNLDFECEPFHKKVNDIVADDLLSVKIKAMEHFLVHLFPERNLGHVASPSTLAGIAQQRPVFREIMDVMVFDSYIVDDGHFSQGILMFNITTPPYGTPS